nr:ABC transporter permease subunit [Actinopolymorpha cephalotaxi]
MGRDRSTCTWQFASQTSTTTPRGGGGDGDPGPNRPAGHRACGPATAHPFGVGTDVARTLDVPLHPSGLPVLRRLPLPAPAGQRRGVPGLLALPRFQRQLLGRPDELRQPVHRSRRGHRVEEHVGDQPAADRLRVPGADPAGVVAEQHHELPGPPLRAVGGLPAALHRLGHPDLLVAGDSRRCGPCQPDPAVLRRGPDRLDVQPGDVQAAGGGPGDLEGDRLGTIIFLAAITQIDPQLYEAVVVDGANAWRRIWHVTLPGIVNVIVLLLILRLGSVLTVGFEQILLQQPAVGADAAQVLDTFVYYRGVLGGDWGLSTTVGLVKGLIGTVLVIGANRLAKRAGTGGVF